MHEGPAGSSNKRIPLQLPPDAKKLTSTSSFDLYRSSQQQGIVVYPTDYHSQQLHINAADLEKIIAGEQISGPPRESSETLPEKIQFYDRTANWEVYAATGKVIVKSKDYHAGQLVLTFKDLKILRGLSHPR